MISLIFRHKHRLLDAMLADPVGQQQKLFRKFIRQGQSTSFGKDHHFNQISDYQDFTKNVPLRDYEALRPYLDRVVQGERNVLWPGKPIFLGKTSGTTSHTKYLPVTSASLSNQIHAPQYVGINYGLRYHKFDFLKGKSLLFSDGHFFEQVNGIKAAPISTIANSCIPFWFRGRRIPSDAINAIPDYETRIDAMIRAALGQDIRMIVAMPVWLLVFLRALEKKTGKRFSQLFPNFRLLLLSGMDYEPFLPEIRQYIDLPFDVLETFPSTEAFIAYQDRLEERGMQLVLNNGIFFEFVPLESVASLNPQRLSLAEVQVGATYALVLNTNAGLWGYLNGDTVRFRSVFPHRIEITGRIAQYISAFGEHITVEETDKSLAETARQFGATVVEYTVAPHISHDGYLPYHEWFIEFGNPPTDLPAFARSLDEKLQLRNFSYKDVVVHKAIAPLKIRLMPKGGFEQFLQASGKTGFQRKIPHLSNHDKLARAINETIFQLHSDSNGNDT
ncbi:MAG: GH3 auxin-responsive promoter family protein [Saprospiraceae bacterium]|nr:GH3 auxin-responsive promoter family protein [Saprospiraceae bacterium]